MIDLVPSLSLASGAVCVAVLSALAGFAVGAARKRVAIGASMAAAFAVAALLYWAPVLLGAPSGEYLAWFPLFLACWFLAGACAAVAAVALRRKLLARHPTLARIALVAGGYLAAALIATLAVAVNEASIAGAGNGSDGMVAFGDLILFCAVFGFVALFPTGAAVYFVRSRRSKTARDVAS